SHLLASVVARTHQRGWAAWIFLAAVAAVRALENTPKQLAPDPDMRAKLHPDESRSASSAFAMAGTRTMAVDSRSLAWFASMATNAERHCGISSVPVVRFCSAGGLWRSYWAKTRWVASASPELTKTMDNFGMRTGSERISPLPLMMRERG